MSEAAGDPELKHGKMPGPDNGRHEQRVRRDFWRTLKRAARHIPFSEEVLAGYYCFIDRETPARVRATLLAAFAYFVVPADAIPDIVAGIGFTDDATVLLAMLGMVRVHIRPRHRESARQALAESGPAPG